MFMNAFLIFLPLVIAIVSWLIATNIANSHRWGPYTILVCSIGIGFIGLSSVFEGYFARQKGIDHYKNGQYQRAIEKLEITIDSPFANREALGYLSLAWKKQAEIATIDLVKESNFLTAINYMKQSINEYPCSLKAYNNLINIFRITKRWGEAEDALDRLLLRVEMGFPLDCNDPPTGIMKLMMSGIIFSNIFLSG